MEKVEFSLKDLPGFSDLAGFKQLALKYTVEEVLNKKLKNTRRKRKRIWLIRGAYEPWMEEWLRALYVKNGAWKTMHPEKITELGSSVEWNLFFSKKDEEVVSWITNEKRREVFFQITIVFILICISLFFLFLFLN